MAVAVGCFAQDSLSTGRPASLAGPIMKHAGSEEAPMIRNPRIRRSVALALMVVGGIFIFLAPDDVALGVVLLVLGLGLEVAGTLMQRRSGR